MNDFFEITGLILLALMLPILWRALRGPTAIDRIVAVNMAGTKTVVLLIIIGTLYGRLEMFIDFALTYALLNFVGSLAASRMYAHAKQREAANKTGVPIIPQPRG